MKKYVPILLVLVVLAVLATVVIIITTNQNTPTPVPTAPATTAPAATPTAPAPTAPAATTTAPAQTTEPMDSAVGAFSTQDLEGSAVDTSIFSGSKLTLINVWATYCPPCVDEIPDLAKLDKEIEDFQVLGILIDAGVKGFPDQANLDLGKQILSDSGVEYVNILPDLKIIDKFLTSVYAVPTSLFVDEKGQKVGKEIVGSKNYDDWKAEIESKLAEINAR
jgi:thiol-disulfide isomerase/thioredoxin